MVGDETMSTTLAIGVGCRLGCEAHVIEALVRQALDRFHADWNLVYLARSSRERSRSTCDAGEGRAAGKTLTRLAPLADLSRE